MNLLSNPYLGMILPVLFEEEGAQYVTQFTRNVHLLVNEVASLAIYLMELLSALIIVFTTVRAFIKLLRRRPYARVYLLHGQSIGLTFKLGSEILRTITVRNTDEIWQIFLLIVIKACMVLLIDWELKSASEHDDPNEAVAHPAPRKPKQSLLGTNIFYKGTHFFDTGSMIRNAENALKTASDDLQALDAEDQENTPDNASDKPAASSSDSACPDSAQ